MSQMPLFPKYESPELPDIGVDKAEKQDKTCLTIVNNGMLKCSTKDCRWRNSGNTCSCPSALNIQNGKCDVYNETGKLTKLEWNERFGAIV